MIKRGFLITIFTNGGLITKEVANLFKNYPPHHLKINLYAGSPEGYGKVTGDPDIFKMIKKGLNLLKGRKVDFTIGTLITNINFEEFEKIKEFTDSLRVKFWAGTSISPSVTREFSSQRFSITPEQQDILIKYYGNDILKWKKNGRKRVKTKGCKGCFFISSDGRLLSCPLYRKWYSYDLEKMGLRKAWEKRLKRNIKLKCPV